MTVNGIFFSQASLFSEQRMRHLYVVSELNHKGSLDLLNLDLEPVPIVSSFFLFV